MNFNLGKTDRLKSKKIIDRLFKDGKSLTVFPLRLVYLETDLLEETKVGFSVSKRLHKTAIARNRIKRFLRETYRLNCHNYFNNSTTSYALMILYISTEGTTFADLKTSMTALFKKFSNETTPNKRL